jgi:hypothetical protein
MSVGVMTDYKVKCSAGGGGEEMHVKVVSGQIFQLSSRVPPRDGKGFKGFLPQLDEIYFTTAKKKILENCRCIVPNFMND